MNDEWGSRDELIAEVIRLREALRDARQSNATADRKQSPAESKQLSADRDQQPVDRKDAFSCESTEALNEALRQAEARTRELEAVVNSVPDGLVVFDLAGKPLFSNAIADEIHERFNIQAGDSITEKVSNTYREDGRPLTPDESPLHRAFVHDEVTQDLIVSNKPENGQPTHIAMSCAPIRLQDESVTGAVMILRDITEQRRLGKELQQRELLLRTLIQSTPDFLYIKDRDSRVVFVNEAFGKIFQVDITSVIGKNDFELFDNPELAAQSIENDRRVMETGVSETFEESARAPDGLRYFQLFKSPWRNEQGAVIGIVGSGMDITERKHLEFALRQRTDELTEADQNKNQFLNTLSHELRNPLATIVASLDLLTHTRQDPARSNRIISVLQRQSAHLSQLVDDLLDITRITTNKIRLRKEPTDLVDLLQRLLADYQPAFADKGITLDIQLPTEPLPLLADRVRLAQAFGNLLHNAVKFTPESGHVVVTARCDADAHEACVTIMDNGDGIDPDILPNVFEPFSQAEQTLARSQGGLGLGLSIVKGMVELHDGRVEAHSDGPGTGTRFTVRLPLA